MTAADRAAFVKKLHADRFEAGLCIYDGRNNRGKPHGPPVKRRMCTECIEARKPPERRKEAIQGG